MTTPPGPRIPPLPPDEWSADVKAGIAALRPAHAQGELRGSKGGRAGLNGICMLDQHP